MNATIQALHALFLGVLLACQTTPAPARTLQVWVRDDEGKALQGVAVEVDGLASIKTGHDGSARVSLATSGPARARIGVSCPGEYRQPPPRHIPRAVAGGTTKLELSFSCHPRQRTLAVVVRAPGAQGLLVRADGEPLGRIEADGTLHATLLRAPESDLRLMLETGDRPVTPRNPTHELRVADQDELVVFDPRLAPLPARSRRRAPLAAPKPAAVRLPYNIRSNAE